DARIVEKAVDRAIGVECRFDIGPHLGRFGHVGSDEMRLAALLSDDPDGRLAGSTVAVDDDHLGATLGKGERRGAADAVSGTGDQRDLAEKMKTHGFPPLFRHMSKSMGRSFPSPPIRRPAKAGPQACLWQGTGDKRLSPLDSRLRGCQEIRRYPQTCRF